MADTKHTPMPWISVPQNGGGDLIAHEFATGKQMNPKGLRIVAFMMARSDSLLQDEANARLIAAAPDLLANLTNLQRAYVNLLETGRDKIISLGGECDPVDVMERNDPYLKDSRAAIKKATGE